VDRDKVTDAYKAERYTKAVEAINSASYDEARLDGMARDDDAGVGPAILLLAIQVAKLRSLIAMGIKTEAP